MSSPSLTHFLIKIDPIGKFYPMSEGDYYKIDPDSFLHKADIRKNVLDRSQLHYASNYLKIETNTTTVRVRTNHKGSFWTRTVVDDFSAVLPNPCFQVDLPLPAKSTKPFPIERFIKLINRCVQKATADDKAAGGDNDDTDKAAGGDDIKKSHRTARDWPESNDDDNSDDKGFVFDESDDLKASVAFAQTPFLKYLFDCRRKLTCKNLREVVLDYIGGFVPASATFLNEEPLDAVITKFNLVMNPLSVCNHCPILRKFSQVDLWVFLKRMGIHKEINSGTIEDNEVYNDEETLEIFAASLITTCRLSRLLLTKRSFKNSVRKFAESIALDSMDWKKLRYEHGRGEQDSPGWYDDWDDPCDWNSVFWYYRPKKVYAKALKEFKELEGIESIPGLDHKPFHVPKEEYVSRVDLAINTGILNRVVITLNDSFVDQVASGCAKDLTSEFYDKLILGKDGKTQAVLCIEPYPGKGPNIIWE